MKKYLFGYFLLLLITSCCDEDHVPGGVPYCITQETITFSTNIQCSDSSVKEYTFEGESVFVFDGQSCVGDGGIEVKNAQCEVLGFLGGFSGNSKINGVEFFENADFVRTLWEN